MATVKGKWLFNDVVSSYWTSTFFDVSFTSNGNSYIAINPYFNSVGVMYLCYVTSYNFSTGTGDKVYRFDNSTWYGDYKTIDFGTTEQTVSDKFYTWLIDNAKEVKAISGKRRFKDKLTQMPFEGAIPINFTFNLTNANFETAQVYTETISAYGFSQEPYNDIGGHEGGLYYHYGGSGFDALKGKYLYSGLIGWCTHYFGQTREKMAQELRSLIPDIDDTTLNYYLDELYKCYGEGIKTVDFGTEPQYIPVDAHDWIMENTEPVIKAGTYRWNDELTDLGYTTEIFIPFTVPPYVEIDDASVDYFNSEIVSANLDYPLLEYGIITSFVCNSIRFYKNSSYGYYIVEHGIESYTYSSDNPVLNLIFGESREKISEVYHSGVDGVVSGFNTGYLQYLTVLEDTVVEDDAFASWFAENTKPVGKKFTRLYSGDVVASSGGKCFKRLDAEVAPSEPTVSGVWVFGDDISVGDYKEGEVASVNFISGGVLYSSITIWKYPDSFAYMWYDDTMVFRHTDNVWKLENGQTVDFGTTPQTVATTFYDWLTANATKQ